MTSATAKAVLRPFKECCLMFSSTALMVFKHCCYLYHQQAVVTQLGLDFNWNLTSVAVTLRINFEA